jgi:serine/threonine protein kinase
MPINAVVDSALRILEALQYLHKLGFVHGDVKPANCCYGPNGVTLIDIGNSWKHGSSEKPPANSNYLYLPPELMIDDDPIPSPHGDLWGVGIILYQLIEQSFPFGNDVLSSTTLNMLRCYAKREYRDRKPTFNGRVHPIHAIITKMLSYDPSDRYPTAEAVLHDLWKNIHKEKMRTTLRLIGTLRIEYYAPYLGQQRHRLCEARSQAARTRRREGAVRRQVAPAYGPHLAIEGQ